MPVCLTSKKSGVKKSTKTIRTGFTGLKIPNNVPFLFAADAEKEPKRRKNKKTLG